VNSKVRKITIEVYYELFERGLASGPGGILHNVL
jgi:hypothetical protein